ncbi:hypothetical protein DFH07DRAFT_983623 [Mycena maculata]|uniref:DUF7514 domain-containing protein n=1 Tax=Mycena maculata TaxID=230809 RepID=A0AAD7N0X2_9AGAR|nr:hypothetical protein DFH07DRAFT_983623 [Mycena maculata]
MPVGRGSSHSRLSPLPPENVPPPPVSSLPPPNPPGASPPPPLPVRQTTVGAPVVMMPTYIAPYDGYTSAHTILPQDGAYAVPPQGGFAPTQSQMVQETPHIPPPPASFFLPPPPNHSPPPPLPSRQTSIVTSPVAVTTSLIPPRDAVSSAHTISPHDGTYAAPPQHGFAPVQLKTAQETQAPQTVYSGACSIPPQRLETSSQAQRQPSEVMQVQTLPLRNDGVQVQTTAQRDDGVFACTITPPNSGVSQQQTGSTTSAAPDVLGWGHFFAEDMSPTPVFTHLMDAIFTYLDTKCAGTLTPEIYSRFLINQGYVRQENTWSTNLVPSLGQTKEETADAALRRSFDLFSIEYTPGHRPRKTTPYAADSDSVVKRQLKSFGSTVTRAIKPSVVCGIMPLLTRKGFIDITAIEALCNPTRHFGNLVRILKMYDLPGMRTWGDLPRGVLPEQADEKMLARVAQVQALAKEQGQFRQAAVYAKSNAQGAVSYARDKINKIDKQDVVNAAGAIGGIILIGTPLPTPTL